MRAVRHFIRANALPYMWTFTYAAAADDSRQVKRDLERFYARLQAKYGRLPVLGVIERGRRGTRRLHVHLAIDRWLPVEVMRNLWSHGHVWVGDPGKLAGKTEPGKLAGYLSKYVAKQIDAPDGAVDGELQHGQHRYSVTKGWQPECKRRRFSTVDGAAAWLAEHYGAPARVFPWSLPDMPFIHGFALFYGDETIDRWLKPP